MFTLLCRKGDMILVGIAHTKPGEKAVLVFAPRTKPGLGLAVAVI